MTGPLQAMPFRLLLLFFYLYVGWLPPMMLAPAFAVSREPPAEWMEAGAGWFRIGNFQKALAYWEQAAAGYEAAGNLEGQILALVQVANAHLALGQSPKAFNKLQHALALAEQTDNPSLMAAVTSSLGNTYLAAGRVAEAKRSLESSVEIATKAGRRDIAVSALNNLGNLLASQGRFDEAAAVYKQALDAAREVGNDNLALQASINLARTLVDTGQDEKAGALLANVQRDIRALTASYDKAYGLISAGRLYARLSSSVDERSHQWRLQAHKTLNYALVVAEAIDDKRSQSYALGYQGQLYEQASRYEEAMQLTQRAVLAAQQADAPEILYRWQWQTGRLLKAQGRTEEAIRVYQRAIYTLQTIRQDLAAGYGGIRASFRKSVGPVFFELADLLLQRSAVVSDAQEVERYLVDARDTIELLKGAELEDYFQDDCAAALKAKTAGIDQLAERTAAVYPIILQDRTELLLSLPGGLKRFTVSVDANTLTQEVRAFRRRLEKRTTHQYLPHAQRVYDWIIRPIKRELEKQAVDTLVIVPDGPLRTIPMAALHDGKQFLAARYAIATTPGLTLTDPRPIKRENVQLLLNGLSESVQGFPALPNVTEELRTIKTLYGGTVLENQDFVVPKMEEELTGKPYSIVHIASHGQFDSDVTKTFLLTYESKLSMDALEKFMGLTTFRENAVELLTLSACQTAAGDDRAALGLAGIAVKAGARSALATLWIVNDRASALLVSEFYRQLQNPSVSKAKALQQAQLSLLKDRRYRHPGYWSPFLLIGNWL
ncbi:MAG: CHAT domain-containing protein [Acidiferrobacterales bacterium]